MTARCYIALVRAASQRKRTLQDRPHHPLGEGVSSRGTNRGLDHPGTLGGEIGSHVRKSRPHGSRSTIAQTRQDRVQGTGSGSAFGDSPVEQHRHDGNRIDQDHHEPSCICDGVAQQDWLPCID
jgi:hypothetical protein